MLIPILVQRPATARKASGFRPLMETDRAHSSSVEGVPFMAAGAKPAVVLARRPTTKRASNAPSFRFVALLLRKLAIQDIHGHCELLQRVMLPGHAPRRALSASAHERTHASTPDGQAGLVPKPSRRRSPHRSSQTALPQPDVRLQGGYAAVLFPLST